MRALVVYESMFGNTREIAAAIADGLRTTAEVDVVEVGAAPLRPPADVDLLVVGGPTHAFGMSRPTTRQDAGKQAGEQPLVSRGIGIREWLEALDRPARTVRAAAFDTRVRPPRLPGSAARAADRRLRHAGLLIVSPPESFWVAGTPGPLRDGETDRARTWAAGLAGSLVPTR